MQTFDSNGPDVRIRGTAFQVHEKYLQLARDAASSGDRIIAESYLQHAEHYYRIIAAAQEQQAQQGGGDPNRRYRPEGGYGQDYRGPSEEAGGEGGEEFGGEDQGDGAQPRGEMYARQPDTRYPADSRPQQEARHQQDGGQPEGRQRQQHDQNYRGQGERAPRQQSEGDAHRQQQDRGQAEGQQGQPPRQEPETQYRRGPERFDRQDGDGQNRQQAEERPRTREFDQRREMAPPQAQPAPTHSNGAPPSLPDPAPAVAVDTVEAPPRPRRGRPRRAPVVASDAAPMEPAVEG